MPASLGTVPRQFLTQSSVQVNRTLAIKQFPPAVAGRSVSTTLAEAPWLAARQNLVSSSLKRTRLSLSWGKRNAPKNASSVAATMVCMHEANWSTRAKLG